MCNALTGCCVCAFVYLYFTIVVIIRHCRVKKTLVFLSQAPLPYQIGYFDGTQVPTVRRVYTAGVPISRAAVD